MEEKEKMIRMLMQVLTKMREQSFDRMKRMVNNPASVSLLSGLRKPQFRF